MIYFILNRHARAVKIGKSVDPLKRLEHLQIGSPTPLELLGIVDGSHEEERAYHRQFASDRLQGEWFSASEGMLQSIQRICRAASSPTALVSLPKSLLDSSSGEKQAYRELAGLLLRCGHLAFSRAGPLKEDVHEYVRDIIRPVAEAGGYRAMERVFDAIDELAYQLFPEDPASYVCVALEHRFDGLGCQGKGFWFV